MEDIGALLSRGFSLWMKNLNLCLPFLLSIILSMLLLMSFLMSILMILLPQDSLEALAFEDAQNATLMQSQMEDLLSSLDAGQLAVAFLFFLGIMLSISLVDAFFSAAAIGMARQALETGRADTAAMWSFGRKHLKSMFLATLLIGLITFAGLVFVLPAMAAAPNPLQADEETAGLLAVGLLLFLFYALAVSIILIAAPYALVVGDLGPIAAVRAALSFFRYNKFDVAVLWLVVTALSTTLQMLGGATVEGMGAQHLSLIASLANLIVLAPLSCLWWTRLYMNRTGMLTVDEVKDTW